MEKGEYLEKLDYECESHSYEKPLGFLKSRGTFEKTFDGKTSIFISTDCELYKNLKKMERRFMKKQIDDHIFLN
jgi:hypothetical protein